MATEESVSNFVSSLVSSVGRTDYHFPMKLGTDWFRLRYTYVERLPADRYNVSIVLFNITVIISGTQEDLVSSVMSLLADGLCSDCGQCYSADHQCPNTLLNEMFGDLQPTCTLCQGTCKGTTRLPCGHAFHWLCLYEMCGSDDSVKCPNCRRRSNREWWDCIYASRKRHCSMQNGDEIGESDDEGE